jgi:thiamine transport system permease protein
LGYRRVLTKLSTQLMRIFKPRLAVSLSVVLVLLFPFLVILANEHSIRFPNAEQTASVLLLTILQASLSALASVVFGIIGGLGLMHLSSNKKRLVGAIAILPNVVPVLILLLSVMKFFPWARGLTGIVLVHALLNTGLVAVGFSQLVCARLSGLAELAWVEGASSWKFFVRGALPELRGDLSLIFLFVFALSFSSFAVPLMIGGSHATTIEVLIYQKMRMSLDWAEALGLALLQVLAIFSFSFVLQRSAKSSFFSTRATDVPLLKWWPGLFFALAPSAVLLAGLFDGFLKGLQQLRALDMNGAELSQLVAGSILVGFIAGISVVVLLLALAYARPSGFFRRVLIGYAAPSSVLVGLGLLIFWRALGIATIFKIAFGIALIGLPAFYRYQWDALLSSLDGQIQVAKSLGAGDGLVFNRVVFPQVVRSAFSIGGILSLWAWGDFALSSVVAERSVTLAMLVRGMMSSYRLDAATVLIWVLIFGGLCTFAIFNGVGYVLGAKPQT